VTAAGSGYNWHAQFLKVLGSSVMQVLVDDDAEFVDNSL